MRVLITGINGFAGPYLAEHLLATQPEVEICGLAWGREGRDTLTGLGPRLTVVESDLTDPASLTAALDRARPDLLFHLAAASSVASSWSDPALIFQVNVLGQVHLFEALRRLELKPVTVVASSAEIYGSASGPAAALSESSPLAPVSPYGASKAAQDIVAHQYFLAGVLPTVRLRLFNHTGPRRQPAFVASSFARQIARIEKGLQPPVLEVGNLQVYRDFTDVRDVARAYWLAATRGEPGAAYNVCSGSAVSIEEILEHLLALSDLTVHIREDPARLRASDMPIMVGDHSRFTSATGWEPEIPLHRTLADLLDWWRKRD